MGYFLPDVNIMRIFAFNTYSYMKTRLNLTIEDSLLSEIKRYALKRKKSVSQLVEEYFMSIPKANNQESFVEMVKKLKKGSIDENLDLKKEYFEAKGRKYGL